MNTIRKISLSALLLSIIAVPASHAQFTPSPFEVGINAGTLIYQGDLSKSEWGYTKTIRPAIGLRGAKTLNVFFALRAVLVAGSVLAYDSTYSSPAWRKYRDLSFRATIIELSSVAEYYFLGKAKGGKPGSLDPYLFAGIGFSFLKIRRNWSGFDAAYFGEGSGTVLGLAGDTAHRVPSIISVIPIGGGVRYTITEHLSLRAEFTYRLTATDYLDGFKYAGNPNKNDHYYGISIGISYRFGYNRLDCSRSPN